MAHMRRKGKDILNTAKLHKNEHCNEIPAALPIRTVERKIGRATFIVSSRLNDGKEKDIVSTIARVVQHDNDNYNGDKPYGI